MSRHIFHPTDALAVKRMCRQIEMAPLIDAKGRGYIVIFQRILPKKRIPQKGLFYVWAKFIADSTGDDSRSTEQALKAMFMPTVERVNHLTGEIFYDRQSTEDLNEAEWNHLLLRVESFAATELGLALPRRESEAAAAAYRHYSAAMAAGDEP